MSDIEVSTTISADPQVVWRMISDVTRMGEWSPETTKCRWLGGADAAAVGARFRGSNRHGLLRWSTTCTVTAAEPGRRFAFEVHTGPVAIASWAYDIEARDGGAVVTESWSDRRPMLMRLAAVPTTGVADRAAHNRRGMEKTLVALKAAAEAG